MHIGCMGTHCLIIDPFLISFMIHMQLFSWPTFIFLGGIVQMGIDRGDRSIELPCQNDHTLLADESISQEGCCGTKDSSAPGRCPVALLTWPKSKRAVISHPRLGALHVMKKG